MLVLPSKVGWVMGELVAYKNRVGEGRGAPLKGVLTAACFFQLCKYGDDIPWRVWRHINE